MTVWAAVSSHDRPYIIQHNDGKMTNANKQAYIELTTERFQGDMNTFCWLNNADMEKQVFQQDQATTHTGHGNINLLQEVFPNWVTFHALHKVLTFHCVMRICEYY